MLAAFAGKVRCTRRGDRGFVTSVVLGLLLS